MRKKFAMNAKCATTFGTDFSVLGLCALLFPNPLGLMDQFTTTIQ